MVNEYIEWMNDSLNEASGSKMVANLGQMGNLRIWSSLPNLLNLEVAQGVKDPVVTAVVQVAAVARKEGRKERKEKKCVCPDPDASLGIIHLFSKHVSTSGLGGAMGALSNQAAVLCSGK